MRRVVKSVFGIVTIVLLLFPIAGIAKTSGSCSVGTFATGSWGGSEQISYNRIFYGPKEVSLPECRVAMPHWCANKGKKHWPEYQWKYFKPIEKFSGDTQADRENSRYGYQWQCVPDDEEYTEGLPPEPVPGVPPEHSVPLVNKNQMMDTSLLPSTRVLPSVDDSIDFLNDYLLKPAAGATLVWLLYSATKSGSLVTKAVRICSLPFLALTLATDLQAAEVPPYQLKEAYSFGHYRSSGDSEFWNSLATKPEELLRDTLDHLMNLQRNYPQWNPKGYLMAQMVALRLGSVIEQAELWILFKRNEEAGKHEGFSERIEAADEEIAGCWD